VDIRAAVPHRGWLHRHAIGILGDGLLKLFGLLLGALAISLGVSPGE
jgi:hypothetical protein